MSQLPALGAGGLLHPWRRPPTAGTPPGCHTVTFQRAGVALKGWRCPATRPRQGTLVYLHGVADNRSSSAGVIERFTPRGFDVLAYDSRSHGESEGEACTYGYFERHDLRRVLDTAAEGPIVLLGTSVVPERGAISARRAAASDSVQGPAIVWIRIGNTSRSDTVRWFEAAFPEILVALDRGDALVEIR